MTPEAAKPLRVHIALLNEPQQVWEGADGPARQNAILRRVGGHRYVVAENAAEAELIVFLESNGYKDWHAIEPLLGHPLIQRYPERCFTLNYAPTPVPFLPGVYTNLPRSRHAADWTRAGGYYLGNPNPCIAEFEGASVTPKHTLSFRGAGSYPLREELFRRAEAWRALGPITHVNRWFNHQPNEHRDYAEEIALTRFVLCPRGIGCASHRLFEVMRLGRVPVIIADDWVAPNGPDWSAFALTVKEAELDSVPAVIAEAEPRFLDMGRRARASWEEWFAPERILVRQLDEIVSIRRTRGTAPVDFRARWQRRSFFREYGWTFGQRLIRRVRRLVVRG